MAPITAIARDAVTFLFSETLKEGEKTLGREVLALGDRLIAIVQQAFHKGKVEGLLARAERQPTPSNMDKVEAELVAQMEDDRNLTQELEELVMKLKEAFAGTQISTSFSNNTQQGASFENSNINIGKGRDISIGNTTQNIGTSPQSR